MDVGNERTVDLDFIGGDIGQRRQRRIAGTEIVDRDTDTQSAEDRQNLVLEMGLGDERIFRHLDHEPLGKPGRFQRPRKRAHEFGIAGLRGCHIDADGGAGAESLVDEVDRLDDFGEHQMRQFVDQSQFHREIDEGAGGLDHAFIVAQANQRLDALDVPGPDIDLGLKRTAKALFQNGEPQRLLDPHSFKRLVLHGGVEECRRSLAVILDAVHRDVGILAQHVITAPVIRIKADPD